MIPPCLKEGRYRSFFQDNDVEKARILLEEGLKDLGVTKDVFASIVLLHSNYEYSETSRLIQVIQQQWLKALDVFIQIERLDFSILLDRVVSGDYCMSFLRRNEAYPDQMSILERFKYKEYATNFSNWENQKYIALLDRSFYEEEDKRLLTLEEAEKVFINEMPFIPLYHQDYVYIINPRLPFSIPLWSGDRMLLPLSAEEQIVQRENQYAY